MITKVPKIINYITSNLEDLPAREQLKLVDKQMANLRRFGKYIVKNGTKEEKQMFLKTLLETDQLRKNILEEVCILIKAGI